MEKHKIERTINVDVIKFEDGSEIDARIISDFLDEVCQFEDTVGKSGNWTEEYFYFERNDEKILEPILLKLDVIRKSPNHKRHNDRVGEKSYDYYLYWLSDGYFKFRDEFFNLFHK